MSAPVFVVERVVAFSETDAARIVHFSNFFRYMEDCEHAYVRSLGILVHDAAREDVVGFPRVEVSCTYRSPLRFQDRFTVSMWIAERRRRSIRYRFEIQRVGDDAPAAVGQMAVVSTRAGGDGRMKAVGLPGPLVLAEIEEKD